MLELKMKEEIKKAIKVLNSGGIILYPTDTIWGIGCDATNSMAIKKIFKIKNRKTNKSFICLMKDLKMLRKYISSIPKKAELLINNTNPTTIIYKNPKIIPKILVTKESTLAIRIPNHEFCNQLIDYLGKPIVSTSANISGNETPLCFSEIKKSILEGVDHVVNLQKEKTTSVASTIYKIEDNGKLVIIRK
tara:strand:+ start:424 stop:996 length:573 start_codon:yes stop_codon:yes gene_type:complete